MTTLRLARHLKSLGFLAWWCRPCPRWTKASRRDLRCSPATSRLAWISPGSSCMSAMFRLAKASRRAVGGDGHVDVGLAPHRHVSSLCTLQCSPAISACSSSTAKSTVRFASIFSQLHMADCIVFVFPPLERRHSIPTATGAEGLAPEVPLVRRAASTPAQGAPESCACAA